MFVLNNQKMFAHRTRLFQLSCTRACLFELYDVTIQAVWQVVSALAKHETMEDIS